MKYLTITVNQNNIREGRRRINPVSQTCPVARALRRELKQDCWAAFNTWNFKNCYSNCNTLPRRAAKFIEDFDKRKPVKPFKFRIVLPI